MLGRSGTGGSLSRAGSGLRSISGEKMFDLLHRDVSHDPFGILHHQTSGGFSSDLDPFDHACLNRNLSSSPRSSSLSSHHHPHNNNNLNHRTSSTSAKDLRQYELDFVQSGRLPEDLGGLSRGNSTSDHLPPLSSISRDFSMISRDVSLSRLLSRGTSPGLIHLISGASDSFPPLSPIKTPRKLYPAPHTPSSSAFRSNNNNVNSNFNLNTPSKRVDTRKGGSGGGGGGSGSRGSRPPRTLVSPSLDPMTTGGLAPTELALDDQALQAEIDKLKAELAAVEQERPPSPTRSPGLFPMKKLQDLPPPRIVHQTHPPQPPMRPLLGDLVPLVASEPPRRFNDSRKLLTQLKQLQEVPAVPRAPSIHPPDPPPLKEPDLSHLVKLENALPPSPPSPLPLVADVKDTEDDGKVSIGIYTRAERRAKIERFKQKKNRRNFDKKILYACRKSFADSRPRIGGRFVARQDKRPTNSYHHTTTMNGDVLLRDLLALLPLQGNSRGLQDSRHVEDTQALFQQLMLCLPPQEEQPSSPSFMPYQDLQSSLLPDCSPELGAPAPSWPGYTDSVLPPLPIRSISAP